MLKNIFSLWVANIVSGFLGIIIIPLFIHKLGTQVYGYYVILQLFGPDGLLSFFELGITSVLIKLISKYEQGDLNARTPECVYVNSIFLYTLITGFLIFAFFVLGGYVTNIVIGDSLLPAYKELIVYYLLAFALWLVSSVFIGMLEGKKLFSKLRLIEIVTNILFLLLSIFVLGFVESNPLKAISQLFLMVNFARFLVLYLIFRNEFKIKFVACEIKLDVIKEIFNTSRLLLIGRISGILINSVSKVVIAKFSGVKTLAIYDITVKFSKILKSIFSVISTVALPDSVKLIKEKKENLLCMNYTDFVYFATFLSLSFYVVFDFLVLKIFNIGVDYFLFLSFIILEFVFMLLTQYTLIPSNFYIIDDAKLKILSRGAVVNAVTFSLFAYVLTFYFGVVGMYYAKIITVVLTALFYSGHYQDDFGFSLWVFLNRGLVYLASFLSIFITYYFVRGNFWTLFFLKLVIVAICLVFVREGLLKYKKYQR